MEGWEPLLFLFSRRQKQFSEWKMLYISFLTCIMLPHLRSSDLTEYPDPDSPEPCLGSVYIWRPFIPLHKDPLLKIFACKKYPSSYLDKRRSVDSLCIYHLKGHMMRVENDYFCVHLFYWMLGLISPVYKCGHILVNMEQNVVQPEQPSAQHGLPRLPR